MIHQLDFNGLDKVDKAIMRLQTYEPAEGYYLCFSGGKDSCVIKALSDMAGVKYDAHYCVTSVDHPELIRFIKNEFPEVIFDYPRDKDGNRINMWTLIPENYMPPTRIARYCCKYLKETVVSGRLKVTGVRWAESSRRKNSHGEVTFMKSKSMQKKAEELYSDIAYKLTPQGGIALPLDNRENAKMVETCYKHHSATVNPIIDWDDSEVWEFMREYKIPYCKLYDQGYKRLGCIGCPMSSKQKEELDNYPKYKNLYLMAFQKMLDKRKERNIINKAGWETPQEVMDWWLQL